MALKKNLFYAEIYNEGLTCRTRSDIPDTHYKLTELWTWTVT